MECPYIDLLSELYITEKKWYLNKFRVYVNYFNIENNNLYILNICANYL